MSPVTFLPDEDEPPPLAQAKEIAVALCRLSPDARAIDKGTVGALAESITALGLLQPISVRCVDGPAYEVVAGAHRLEAFRRLGRDTIPAFVLDLDDIRAALALIDENLCRNDLTPAERAAALARRKRLYEALHPETAHGGDRRSSRQIGDLKSGELQPEASADRFTAATAAATGASERTVQREAARGEAIGAETLARVVNTSLDKGEELDALARLSPDRRDALVGRAAQGEKVSAKVEAKKERRETRERELGARQAALPQGRFGVILADPEWRFEPYSRKSGMDRAADNHYPTSDTLDIIARPVGSVAAKDAALFLCATAPMIEAALRVMTGWGFAYKTHLVWVKAETGSSGYGAGQLTRPKIGGLVLGTGYWFRNAHELLLVGTRGEIPAPAMGEQWPSVIFAPPGRHSAKPDLFYELIEAYYPSLPKLELNARRRRTGWQAWGNEAPEAEAPPPASDEPFDPDTGEILPAAAAAAPVAEPPSATAPSRPRGEPDLTIPPFLDRRIKPEASAHD